MINGIKENVMKLFRNKREFGTFAREALLILFGSVCYSVAIDVFIAPNKVALGGASGLATAFNYLTGFPIGITVLILNIPLFIVGSRKLGFKFLIKTMVATVVLSLAMDGLTFLPVYGGDRLLASVFGGVLSGLGLGLVFTAGATTGGSDLAGRLLHIHFPHISMGKLILVIDFLVIIVAVVAFRDVESSFYSIIAIFISSKLVDSILNGLDHAKVAYIISDHGEEISAAVIRETRHSVTVLPGKGFYSNSDKPVLLCVVKPYEIGKLKELVRGCDEKAFMILSDASEVLGEGFKAHGI